MNLLTVIRKSGMASYKDLAHWTKAQLNTRDIEGYNDAVTRDQIFALYQNHFRISQSDANLLYKILLEVNFLEEHSRTNEQDNDVAFRMTFGILTQLPDRETEYICTTFNF